LGRSAHPSRAYLAPLPPPLQEDVSGGNYKRGAWAPSPAVATSSGAPDPTACHQAQRWRRKAELPQWPPGS
jgi:hypothetical protein